MSVQKKNQISVTEKSKSNSKKKGKRSKKEANEKFIPAMARRDVFPVDTRNDREMVREGLRPSLIERDPEWHKKTLEEKEKLSKVVKIKNLRASSFYRKENPIKKRLTVYLSNPLKFPNLKTTYSEMIESHKINEYLDLYFGRIKDQVNKIYYNGRLYKW